MDLRLDGPSRLSTDDLVDRLLEVARARLGMDLSWLSTFVDGQQVFERLSGPAQSFGLHDGATLPIQDSYCVRVLDGQLPNLVADAHANPTTAALAITEEANIGSYVGVPVQGRDGQPRGMLCCINRGDAHHLTPRDVQVLEMLAELLAEMLVGDEPAWRRNQTIADRVREAISGEQMRAVFQPIIDITSGEVFAVEALSRFEQAPSRPAVWFDEADSIGLGVELELRAIGLALAELPKLDPSLLLTVNASPRTVCDPRLLAQLQTVDTSRLVVEITEHSAVESYEALTFALESLREANVRIAVDDAGAGFAGLAHVLEIQPSILKIDRSVVKGIHLDPARAALAQAIIGLGERLDAVVVAEGVETHEELERLIQLGVHYMQGFLMGRPQPLPVYKRLRQPVPVPTGQELNHIEADNVMLRRFELAMVHSPVGMALVSPTGVFLHANPALATMLDYTERELTDMAFCAMVHAADAQATEELFDECIAGTRSSWRAERRMRQADGTVVWGDLSVVLVRNGHPQYFIVQVQDVTARRQREEELARLADTDFLTTVGNRSAARRFLDELAEARRGFGVMYCDLRSFKAVNDEFGHAAGDYVLATVAKGLCSVVQNLGHVSRWGGDEFLVVLPGIEDQQLEIIEERLVNMSGRPIWLPDGAGVVEPNLTVGSAVAAAGAICSVDDLLHQADSEMYRDRDVVIRGVAMGSNR